MTMYDGANNTGTTTCTLQATSNTTPSPQVCSETHTVHETPYGAWKAFSRDEGYWYPGVRTAAACQVYFGAGNAKLINKYKLSNSSSIVAWKLQGSNDASAVVGDAIDSSKWTTLDDRPAGTTNVFLTFISDTAYEKIRLYVTSSNDALYEVDELILVEQIIPTVKDVDELSESSDAVDAWVDIIYDVSELTESIDDVLCTKDIEIIDVPEIYESTDLVDVYQDYSICDIDESSESTDTNNSNSGVDIDVFEGFESTESAEVFNTFFDNAVESSTSLDTVDCLKWSGITESITDTVGITDTVYFSLSILTQDSIGLTDSVIARLCILVSEYLTILDSHLVKWNGTKTLTDSFLLYEDIKLQFIKTINEALSLTDSPSAMLELLLSEFVVLTETVRPNWNTTREISSELDLEDSVILKLCVIITDTLALTETQSTILQIRLNEFCLIAATVIPNWNTVREVTETLQLVDSLVQKLTLFLTDALELTDAQALLLSFTLSEFMSIKDNLTSTMSSVKEVTDTISIQDAFYQLLEVILTEALICTDDAPLCQLGLAVYEYLGFTELLSAPGRFSVESSDTLNAVDALNLSYVQTISDVFSLVDVSSVLGALLNSIVENLSITESISASLKSILSVSDALVLTEVIASQGRLYTIIHDALILNTVVEMDGEVWECYVLNTPKFLPSIYSGFNFNSYCVFQNRAYGCKADGIYELTGSTDNGAVINTGVQLSETKFGLPNQKRFRKAYIGVSGTTPLLIMETETGETKTYSIDTDGEVDASRSLRSKKWKLTVTDFESLDFIKLVSVVLAK